MSRAIGLRGSHEGALAHLRRTDDATYQALIEQVPGILYVSETGWDGRWLYVSPQIETLLGWTPQEWMDDPALFSASIHPDDRHLEEDAHLPEYTLPNCRHTSVYRLTTRDGSTRWFRDDATLLPDELGRPSAWSGVLTDITEQRESEHMLRRSDERARLILDTAMDAYVCVDGEGTVIGWNRAAEQMFGWSSEEILGRSLSETVIPERLRDAHSNGLRMAAAEPMSHRGAIGRSMELTGVRRDGRELPVELTIWRTAEEGATRFSAFLRDITDRKNLQAELLRHAYRDSLTGLANRTLFQQRVTRLMASTSRGGFALLLIGLDDFRSVSDSLGHAAAAELVRAVSDRLRTTVSATDTLARLSGDEFALLLLDLASPSDAQRVAETLQDFLRSPTRCGGREMTARVSIGVRHCGRGAEVGGEELLADAGAAMFTATTSGRGVAVFENGMRSDRLRRLQLTEALEHAVGRGEISVHYQPYFSFGDARACGVEALARWRHPVFGDVHPAEFVVLAESTGQIQSLGLHVLRQACRDIAQLRRRHHEHRDLVVSVNVSARQLLDDRFQQALRTVLGETGLPSEALMLELTETALVEDSHDVAERLNEIRSTGVHLAVDDFGTRYASLAYLQRFPIDTLKVDRSFVHRVDRSEYEHRLTGAIITLAKTLGLRTIAEGIEERANAHRLSDLGCDAGQGFLFARPVALDGLLMALRSGEQRMHEGLAAKRGSGVTDPELEGL